MRCPMLALCVSLTGLFVLSGCGSGKSDAPPLNQTPPSPAPTPAPVQDPKPPAAAAPSPLMSVDMIKNRPHMHDKVFDVSSGGKSPVPEFPADGKLRRDWSVKVKRKDGANLAPQEVRDTCIKWIENLVTVTSTSKEEGPVGEKTVLRYTAPGVEGTAVVQLVTKKTADLTAQPGGPGEVRYKLLFEEQRK